MIPRRTPSVVTSLVIFTGFCAVGYCQDSPVPRRILPKAGVNETPKDPTEKPRNQSVAEHIPPVKIGADLETTPDGVLIKLVAPGSAADEAGLQAGDLILRVAGSQVLTPTAVDSRFHKYQAGTKLEIVALRKGREVKAMLVLPKTHEPVLLDPPKETPPKVTVINPGPTTAVEPVSDLGWELQDRDGKVWISNVVEKSVIAAAGLRKGDVIVRSNRSAVTSAQALSGYVGGLAPSERVSLVVERGTKTAEVEVVIPATRRVTAFVPATAPSDATVNGELLARLKVQEELLVKALAELQALRAELKARP